MSAKKPLVLRYSAIDFCLYEKKHARVDGWDDE